MAYMINSACTKCGSCLPECPTNSIIEGTTQYYIDADTCANHAACVNVCPVNAILKRDDLATKDRGENDAEEEA